MQYPSVSGYFRIRKSKESLNMNSVLIRGDGVAAYCCAHLLGRAGYRIELQPADRPRLPAIMLNHRAVALIRDVFDNQTLLRNAPAIHKRMVSWGDNSNVLAVDHSGIVVSEEALLEELSFALPDQSPPALTADWTIHASKPIPGPSDEHCFGTRVASAVPVTLKSNAGPLACWIESLDDGWLFLIPSSPESAWLLAVGNAPENLLAASAVIANEIDACDRTARQFPAYPRIVSPLAGSHWLACGTAAMAFDPLCGDGTAHAIREAILASAVIKSVAKDEQAGILAHYDARLTAGFRRHLALCHQFYRSGGNTPWWRKELAGIESGLAWCDQKLKTHGDFRYRLADFELQLLA